MDKSTILWIIGFFTLVCFVVLVVLLTKKKTSPTPCNGNDKLKAPDCTECSNGKFKPPDCTECINDKLKAPDCTECSDPFFKSPECTECSDSTLLKPNCIGVLHKKYSLQSGIDFTKESGGKIFSQINDYVKSKDGAYWSWNPDDRYTYCKNDCQIKEDTRDGVILTKLK